MPQILPASLVRFAEHQQQVLSRAQLTDAGVLSHHVWRQRTAGRWQAAGRRAVVLHNGPLTQRQRWWVAFIKAGPSAALTRRTAAEALGLTGFAAPEIHLVVPFGTRGIGGPGVSVHHSRRYDPAERRIPAGLPPTVRLERALIDAAAAEHRPAAAIGLLAAGVQQGLTSAGRLGAALRQAGPIRNRRLMRLNLGDIAGGAQSFAEIDFGRLARLAGLGPPLWQVVRRDAHGRRRYLDVVLPHPDGGTFAVEVDGAVHLNPATYWDDMSRGNELVIDGERLLRFSAAVIRLSPQVVIDQLRRMAGLAARPARALVS